MRRPFVCLVLLLVWAVPAFGGVSGRVAAIGFQSYIRAEQWVPLVVRIESDELAAHTFDLRVVQSDLDGDDVVYTRSGLTVNPGTQTFRTYFRPETANGGLPASGVADASELAKRLRIFLYDPTTKNTIRLGVGGATPQALEAGQLSGGVGQKLILVVGRSPSVYDFARDRMMGLSETCVFVQIDPLRLPESSLAYAAADAIVWTDADAGRLDANQKKAVRDYVLGGGTLAVIQNADFGRTAAFSDLLPVTLEQSEEWPSAEPLRSIMMPPRSEYPRDMLRRQYDPWAKVAPPFRLAAATAVDDTVVVDAWAGWPDGRRTPYIARRLHGSGCVAWLAQDVTDPTLANINFGWPRLWERLLDWHDPDLFLTASATTSDETKREQERFAVDAARDLGASFVGGMDVKGRTVALISLSFVFFLGYWALAGPLSYIVLAARKRMQLSWLTFAAIAVVATALTLGISALVLRGDAEVRHVSLVRLRGDAPPRVMSNVGIYLPKDKRADIAVPQTPGGPPAAITPFGADPETNKQDVSPRDSDYAIAVGTDVDRGEVTVSIPFRSTLKKLQTDWTGTLASGIGGKPKLLDSVAEPIEGRVTNDTGYDLRDAILIFRDGRDPYDNVIALPEWKRGQTLDLQSLWKSADNKIEPMPSNRPGLKLFGNGKAVRGRWTDAVTWLQEEFRRGVLGGGFAPKYDDSPESNGDYGHSWPLVALFGRSPMMTNLLGESSRTDLLRRGVRNWDASPAVAAGALVVLGKADGPLPIPLTVDGDTPRGNGRLFYQAALPIDRSVFNTPAAATQPNP